MTTTLPSNPAVGARTTDARNGAITGETRVIATVLVIALCVRVVYVFSFPLIFTKDSEGYVGWALELLDGRALSIATFRTPGYSAMLATVILFAGKSCAAILAVQHVLGAIAIGFIARAVYRLVGPVPALTAGILACFDPFALMSGSYALSEAAAIPLVAIAAAITVAPRRATAAVVAVAVLGGAAVLCRPAVQLMVPFFILACALAPALTVARRARIVAVGAATYLLVLAPWLAFNVHRGVYGVVGDAGPVLFSDTARLGLVKLSDAPPGPRADAFREFEGRVLTESELWRYLHRAHAFRSTEASRDLTDWAWRTITRHPSAYVANVARAMVWQMDLAPSGWRYRDEELKWFLWHLGVDGRKSGQVASNFLMTAPAPYLMPFATNAEPTAIAQVYVYVARRWWRGIPQVPLALCAAYGCWWAVRRRSWPLLTVLLGSWTFVGFHAALLMPFARYALPANAVWYIAMGVTVSAASAMNRSGRRHDGGRTPQER